MNFIYLFLKGIIIGMFMLVPGISGGSIAILLDIYEELLISLNNLFKDFKRNFTILLVVLMGGVIGIFISAYLLDFVFKLFYFEMIFLFAGIMIYYFLSLVARSSKKHLIRNIFLMVFGALLGFLITKIPLNSFYIDNKYLKLFLVGIFLAAALILPGISVSYVLLIFNMYDKVLLAIKVFDFKYLVELFIVLLIGMLIVVKGLNYLLIKKKEVLENVIVGFIFSSIWLVLPEVSNNKDFIYMIILITLGIIFQVIFNVKKT